MTDWRLSEEARGDPRVENEQHRIEGFPQRHGDIARSCHAVPGSLCSDFRSKFGKCRKLRLFHSQPRNFQDPELANSEVSGRTFNSIVNRNHVSEASLHRNNVANAFSRDVSESLFLCHFSARGKSETCSGRQFQFFFTGAGCQASREPFCFIDRSKSNCSLPIAKQKEPRPTKKAWRSRTPVVERNRGLTDWRLVPQKSRRLPKSDFATSSGPTNSFDIRISKNVRIWRVTQRKGQVRTREISHVFNVQLLAVELWNRSLFSCLPCIWDDVVDARNRGCSGYRRLEKVLLVYSETVSRLRDAARQDRNHIKEHLGELELQEESVCGRAGNPSRQSISLRTTFACMIHEHFRITGTHDKCLKNYLILSGSLSEETTFKDSIHSETKFSHLLEKLPRMTHWKVCTENLEIRNNWRPHLHCTIEIPYRRMNQRATHA